MDGPGSDHASRLQNLLAKRQNAKAKQTRETVFRSEGHRTCYKVLHHQYFELLFGAVIVFNLVAVIMETDAVAKEEDAPAWLYVSGLIVLTLFIFELALRLFVLKLDFFYDESNVSDFVLVVTDAVFNVVGPLVLGKEVFPVSFLRVARLCKLARVSKAFDVFPELRLMMAGLIGSLKVIFWGTVLLSFAVLVFAVLAVQFIQAYNLEVASSGGYPDCERCPRAYATVYDATLTLVQQVITGDDWSSVTVPVIDHAPSTAIFFALVYLIIGMALINLILGVVVGIASTARERMSTEMDEHSLMEKLEEHCGLHQVVKQLDKGGNGEITRSDLMDGYEENEHFREALDFIGISRDDLEVLWTILDTNKTGAVSYTDFVTNCYKLKTSNTHFILAHVTYNMTVIKNILCEQIEGVLQAENKILEGEDEIKKAESNLVKQMDHLEELEVEGNILTEGILEEVAYVREVRDAQDQMIGQVTQKKRASSYGGASDSETKLLFDLGTCLTGELKTVIDGFKSMPVSTLTNTHVVDVKAETELVTSLIEELKTLVDGVKTAMSAVPPMVADVDEMVEKELVTCLFGELKILVADMKSTRTAMPDDGKVEKLVEYTRRGSYVPKDESNASLVCMTEEWQSYSDMLQKLDQQQTFLVQLVQGIKYKLDSSRFSQGSAPSTPAQSSKPRPRQDNFQARQDNSPRGQSSFAIPTGLVDPELSPQMFERHVGGQVGRL